MIEIEELKFKGMERIGKRNVQRGNYEIERTGNKEGKECII